MLTAFPSHITFHSDSTEAKLIQIVAANKTVKVSYGVYEYVRAVYFMGSVLALPLSQIETLLSNRLITVN